MPSPISHLIPLLVASKMSILSYKVAIKSCRRTVLALVTTHQWWWWRRWRRWFRGVSCELWLDWHASWEYDGHTLWRYYRYQTTNANKHDISSHLRLAISPKSHSIFTRLLWGDNMDHGIMKNGIIWFVMSRRWSRINCGKEAAECCSLQLISPDISNTSRSVKYYRVAICHCEDSG